MTAEMNGYMPLVEGEGATRVLVIDDEAPIRLLCRVNLEAEGITVLEAADGTTGLDLARNKQPDVVLLDVMMPGLDGWRVAEELLEDQRTQRIPIIFLTARAEFRDRARGLDIGGVDYVTKPFNPLELAPLVRGLLGRIDRGERDELRGEKLVDPGLRDLSFRDWRAIFVRAVKQFLENNGTLLASALAYSTFFAIPAVLLVVVGVFTLLVGPATISALMAHFSHVMPGQAASLLGGSLHRLDQRPSTGITMTIVGFVLALWATTGAMTSYMTALNLAYERKDGRSFVRKRVVAVGLVAVIGLAFLLVAVLLIFGPPLEQLVASHAGGAAGAVGWIWWIAEWPILVVGL